MNDKLKKKSSLTSGVAIVTDSAKVMTIIHVQNTDTGRCNSQDVDICTDIRMKRNMNE